MTNRLLERVIYLIGIAAFIAIGFVVFDWRAGELGAARADERTAIAQRDTARRDALRHKVKADSLEARAAVSEARGRRADARTRAAEDSVQALIEQLDITDTAAVRVALDSALATIARGRATRDSLFLVIDDKNAALAERNAEVAALRRENAAIDRRVDALRRQIPSTLDKAIFAVKVAAVVGGATLIAGAAAN